MVNSLRHGFAVPPPSKREAFCVACGARTPVRAIPQVFLLLLVDHPVGAAALRSRWRLCRLTDAAYSLRVLSAARSSETAMVPGARAAQGGRPYRVSYRSNTL